MHEQGFGTGIYGGRIGNAGAYRVFASGLNDGHLPSPVGTSGQDAWKTFRAGFRSDASLSAKDSLTFQGDFFKGKAGETDSVPTSISPPVTALMALQEDFSGWDVLSRWNHSFSRRSETSLQIYFDRANRGDMTFGVALNTFDIAFQHHIAWGSRQDFVWGFGYRLNSDNTTTTFRIAFNPTDRTSQLLNSFVQDEITILPNRLYATLGAKLERDDYVGVGWEPSARMVLNMDKRNMLWGAVSRALRTPNRSDTAVRANLNVLPGPNGLPLLVSVFGNPYQQSQSLTAFEAGYRNQLTNRMSLDLSVFYNEYDHLRSTEPGAPFLETSPAPPHLVAPQTFANGVFGETHGVEASANWRITDRWSLSPGYAFLTMHLHREAISQDTATAAGTEKNIPNNQAQLRSHVDLPWHLQWEASASFVGRLATQAVPSYTRLDTNVIWAPAEHLSLKLVGQNLLKDRHLEFNDTGQTALSTLVKRSFYVELTAKF